MTSQSEGGVNLQPVIEKEKLKKVFIVDPYHYEKNEHFLLK